MSEGAPGSLRVAKSTVKVRRLSLFSSFRVIDQIMGSFPHSLIFRILPHRRQQRWGPRIIRHCPSAFQQIGFDCWREVNFHGSLSTSFEPQFGMPTPCILSCNMFTRLLSSPNNAASKHASLRVQDHAAAAKKPDPRSRRPRQIMRLRDKSWRIRKRGPMNDVVSAWKLKFTHFRAPFAQT